MHNQNDELELEEKIEILKLANARLRMELQHTQDFCIESEKKKIEYIYHLGQYKSHWFNKLEAWIERVIRWGRARNSDPSINTSADSRTEYARWLKCYENYTENDRRNITSHILSFDIHKKFSIIVHPGDADDIEILNTIASLRAQHYRYWQLIIVTYDTYDKELCNQILSLAEQDSRIRIFNDEMNSQVNSWIFQSAQTATGDFIALINSGDMLREDTLYQFAIELDECPNTHCMYCDEDVVMPNGDRVSPCFKPDWNLELYLSQNYIGSFSFIARDIFLASAIEFALKNQIEAIAFHAFTTAPRHFIRHIPAPLYHRYFRGGSLEMPAWLSRSSVLTQKYFEKMCKAVEIASLPAHAYGLKITRSLNRSFPLVTVIIPTRNRPDLLGVCLDGLFNKTSYKNLEVIIIDHENNQPDAIQLIKNYSTYSNVKIIHYQGIFDHSDMNNRAALQASGDILLFLNDDIEIIEPGWLTEIVSRLSDDDCGVVGPRLLYPSRKIQHAGVVLGFGGVAGHAYVGRDVNDQGYFGRLLVASEVSALTGACMAMRRKLFEEVGGFSANYLQRTFNDVDLCLKARSKGKINIFTPFATLIHHESATDGGDIKLKNYQRLQREVSYMYETWGLMRDDPYYNLNLALEGTTFELAFPPRRLRPINQNRYL